MVYQKRLHVDRGFYFVRDEFRGDLDVLVADPGREHSVDRLEQIRADRFHYCELLEYIRIRWLARIHAHCFLPDGALLLIQVRYAPLGWIMHSLRSSFSHYLTDQRQVRRPYPSRYQSLLIDEREFFWDVVRYVLEQPVTRHLCNEPLRCEYSSIGALLGEPGPAFLAESALLSATRRGRPESQRDVLKFLREGPQPGFTALIRRGSRSDARILGRSDFVRQIRARASAPQRHPSPEHMVEWVAGRMGLASSEIRHRSHHAAAVTARAMLAWLASCAGFAPVSQVAHWLPASERSSLERGLRSQAAAHPELFSEAILEEFHGLAHAE